MQLSDKEIQNIRARLANRKSFFGSSLNTAGASVTDKYISGAELKRAEEEAKAAAKVRKSVQLQKSGFKDSIQSAGIKDNNAPEIKAQRANYALFNLLSEDTRQKEGSKGNASNSLGKPAKSEPTKSSQTVSRSPTPPINSQGQNSHRNWHTKQNLNRGSPLPSPKQGIQNGKINRSHSPQPNIRWGDFTRLLPPNGAKTNGDHQRSGSLSRYSPPPKRSHQLPSQAQTQKNNAVKSARGRNAQARETSRKNAIAPQALGGLTRSQKAMEAWASQLEKARQESGRPTPSPSPPPMTNCQKRSQMPVKGPIARNPNPVNRNTISQRLPVATQSKPVQSVKQNGISSQNPVRPGSGNSVSGRMQPFERMNLIGKDLSKLPQWQRDILLKKQQAQRKRARDEESETDSELDDFVVDDQNSDWRNELKSITGYDPSKFRDEKDDRSMEADWKSIQAEERRSARMGRGEDEKAEMEELARIKEKAARKKARKSSNTSFLL